MIKNVKVSLINGGRVCDLVPYKKGFILLDSSTGEEIEINLLSEIECIQIKDDKGNELDTYVEEN